MEKSTSTGRFTAATDTGAAPRGVSRAEGWWIIGIAVSLTVLHAVMFQTAAMEWGGIIRFTVLLVMIVASTWLSLQRRSAERVHSRNHRRNLYLAGGWAILVVVIAGWFWTAQATGAEVSWLLTTAVSVLAFAPLAWVGWRLAQAGRA